MDFAEWTMTFQAWKMVFLNSMTFHDQGAPWFNVRLNTLKSSRREPFQNDQEAVLLIARMKMHKITNVQI